MPLGTGRSAPPEGWLRTLTAPAPGIRATMVVEPPPSRLNASDGAQRPHGVRHFGDGQSAAVGGRPSRASRSRRRPLFAMPTAVSVRPRRCCSDPAAAAVSEDRIAADGEAVPDPGAGRDEPVLNARPPAPSSARATAARPPRAPPARWCRTRWDRRRVCRPSTRPGRGGPSPRRCPRCRRGAVDVGAADGPLAGDTAQAEVNAPIEPCGSAYWLSPPSAHRPRELRTEPSRARLSSRARPSRPTPSTFFVFVPGGRAGPKR